MRTGRPIGENMMNICLAVERLGPVGPKEVADVMNLRPGMVRAYVCRAADRGMLVREGRRYVVASQWREIAGHAIKRPPNSVFQMGDRAMGLIETARRVMA